MGADPSRRGEAAQCRQLDRRVGVEADPRIRSESVEREVELEHAHDARAKAEALR
jgi:hypothetical protein